MPAAVLDIVDCSGHVSKGYKKDAAYVAELFLPHMKKLDPKKELFDFVTFDGASNVQKAGLVIQAHFPKVYVTHGAEHVCALVFEDCFKLAPLKLLSQVHARLRDIFGSVRHSPAAMFAKHSKEANNGVSLGFIKPVETRMAKEMIALLRLNRLRNPLVSTTCSTEFRR